MEEFIIRFNDFLWTYIVTFVLLGGGIFFTIKFGFLQVRRIPLMVKLLFAKNENSGGISSFQAFAIGTANRVGTGNIAGVATAIALGGPGAVFWMWVIAVIGAASAFVESTLAQVYKEKDGDAWRGGPAYYIQKGLGNKALATVFCLATIIGFGIIIGGVQANTISAALNNTFGINETVTAVLLAIVTLFIISGGVKLIARTAEVLVPIMAGGYVLLALVICLINLEQLPEIFRTIVASGMGIEQVVAGGLGYVIMTGVRRGLFSNEAGLGSGPHAAATADTSHPAKQGYVQILGVFIDTLVICSATAAYVLIADLYATSGLTGIDLAQASVAAELGDFAMTFMTVAIILFAFTSIIGGYYYGETNIRYLKDDMRLVWLLRFMCIGMVMFGAVQDAAIVWALADIGMGIMAAINIIAILMLRKTATLVYKDFEYQKAQGLDPVFRPENIDGLQGKENITAWNNANKDYELKKSRGIDPAIRPKNI